MGVKLYVFQFFGDFGGRVEKQEMWIANKVMDQLPCQEIISKAWEQKPDSYIIFKDLLKNRAIDQVFSLFHSHKHTC